MEQRQQRKMETNEEIISEKEMICQKKEISMEKYMSLGP